MSALTMHFWLTAQVARLAAATGDTNAESPTGLVDLLTALVNTLSPSWLASTCILALVILIRTPILEALNKCGARVDAAQDCEEAQSYEEELEHCECRRYYINQWSFSLGYKAG
jgi:hypothetical protein